MNGNTITCNTHTIYGIRNLKYERRKQGDSQRGNTYVSPKQVDTARSAANQLAIHLYTMYSLATMLNIVYP